MTLSSDYIEDIVQQAERFDFLQYATENSYIDGKDTVSNWGVAIIKENLKDEEQLSVNYDGWKSSYDENLDYISSRIEPFRMITVGYTGQKNNTKRDTFKFNINDLDDLK